MSVDCLLNYRLTVLIDMRLHSKISAQTVDRSYIKKRLLFNDNFKSLTCITIKSTLVGHFLGKEAKISDKPAIVRSLSRFTINLFGITLC